MVEGERRKRVRAFKPKTSSGCLTCRFRRIKCDEAKPFCLKCTSTGRKCDGYTTNTDKELIKPNHSDATDLTACSVISRVSVAPFFGTKEERQSFYFFQQETIPQVCGFYSSDFWTRAVLQACCHNSTIRHAAIALGSLHERHQYSDPFALKHRDDVNAGGFPLQQYNKAIRLLLQPAPDKKQPDMDVALITCILFICFDALRGHLWGVMSHIDGGVKILSDLQSGESGPDTTIASTKSSTSSFVPMATLNKLFTRLDLQATGMFSSRPLGLVPNVDLEALVASPEVPKAFNNLEEARISQEYTHSCWSRAMQLAIPEGTERIVELKFASAPKEKLDMIGEEYTGKMQQWGEMFEDFLARKSTSLDSDELQAIRKLQLQQLCNFIFADVNHQVAAVDETIWDLYTLQFQEIVSLASDILSFGPSSEKPLLSLDTGIISPLFLVASRCRDPSVRRQAIACLKSTKRQEGLWQSQLVGHVAQRVMEIEETAAGINITGLVYKDLDECIPSWARVRSVQPELNPDGRMGVVHYVRHGSNSEDPFKNALHEALEW